MPNPQWLCFLPRLTMSRREDVSVGDEDAAALVLGEEAEQGRLLD